MKCAIKLTKIFSLLTIMLGLASCNSSNSSSSVLPSQNNIFFENTDQDIHDDSLIGLWESEEYQNNGLTLQLRLKVTNSHTILAKRCTTPGDKIYYVQVMVNSPLETLQTSVPLTPFSIPVENQEKINDLQIMKDNIPCLVSIDPSKIQSDSIIASGTSQIQIPNNDFSNGTLEIHFVEENRTGSIIKIGN